MPANSPVTVAPLRNARELSALLDILAPTFNFTREQGERYTKIVGRKNYRVVRRGSTVLGGCALLPMGQYFGGNRVPMMGVGAVGIAPEHRGQRVATTLMQSALLEMHNRGCPLSVLYPATLPLYRSVGYEHAGSRFEMRIAAKPLNFRSLDRGSELETRRATPRDDAAIRRCYLEKASRTNGNIDRSEFIWSRVHRPRGLQTMGFVVAKPKSRQIEGYTFYLQKETPEAPYSLFATDLVALTPAAGRRLLSFFADHRSMSHEIIFQGSPIDPILTLMPERNYTAKLLDHWMLRIVDVRGALEQRGYAKHVTAEAHLDIADDLISANRGRIRLSVRNGKASVKRGGSGAVRIDIRGLASLYAGHRTPDELLVTGQVECAGADCDDHVQALASIFAGMSPTMPDMF